MHGTIWIVIILCVNCVASYRQFFSGSLARKSTSSKCRSNQHECGSSECLSEDLVCDGKNDCSDGSDEAVCTYFPCPKFAFQCTYGGCINADLICNGISDCMDHSDESQYLCNKRQSENVRRNCSQLQYECRSGECIDDYDLCDGKIDCQDGTDEIAETCSLLRCPHYAFKCDYGACINGDLRCDGRQHCVDGSDEKFCGKRPIRPKCRRNQFKCTSGECLDDYDLCDGVAHCLDASDETTAACAGMNCPKFAFRCDYGACVTARLQCDGREDCYDGSDELSCWNVENPSDPSRINKFSNKLVPARKKHAQNTANQDYCSIPPNIPNGWTIIDPTTVITTTNGDFVKRYGVVQFKCRAGYALYPENAKSSCDHEWGKFPVCLQTCSTISQTTSVHVTCSFNIERVPCETPKHGTMAAMSCAPGYHEENAGIATNHFRFCHDGSWDQPRLHCVSRTRDLSAQPAIRNYDQL